MNIFIKIIKTNINKTTKIAKSKKIFRKDWIFRTPGIYNSILYKEFLWNLYRENMTNSKLKKEYKDYDKVLYKVIKAAKKLHENEEAKKSRSSSKNNWNFINKVTGNNKKKSKSKDDILQLNKDNNKIINKQEISNTFNEYFTSIVSSLATDIYNSKSNIKLDLPDFNTNSFFLTHTNKHEIKNLIINLPNKTGGVDGIT